MACSLALLLGALLPLCSAGILPPRYPNVETTPLDGRIVGGVETTIQQFPHQVSFQRDASHICGASILNESIILTAAHCVTEYNRPQLYTIRAGSTEHARGGQLIKVQRILPHALYNEPTSLNNDIALVELERPLSFSSSIGPIALATPEDVLASAATLFVSGWGAISSTEQRISPRLRYTVVRQVDQSSCASAYRGSTKITETMLCAGMPNGGRDSCQGDSGGPLVAYVQGQLKLIGIVSWGIGCAHPKYPGVYTRVSNYALWVDQMENKLMLS